MAATKARIVAFYLPQFHPIPENDEWWGKGFTEWTNVARAKPLFHGHKQPKLPADLGFYDLRLPEVRVAQAEMARSAGVEAFCYWHYWFAGDRLLERPFDEVLESGEPDFPFCLAWANETWSGIWHGAANRILKVQTYPGPEDHRRHFDWLSRAFHDRRYVRVEGRPLLMVYRPTQIPNLREVTDLWRILAEKAGLPGLHLVGNADAQWNAAEFGFDGVTISNQSNIRNSRLSLYRLIRRKAITASKKLRLSRILRTGPAHVYKYSNAMKFFLEKSTSSEYYPCAIPNWDNSPRSGSNGLVLTGSTPELFRQHFREAISRVQTLPFERRIVFLKSWNEWAEGNYVEPDLEFGHAYLEVIRNEVLSEGSSIDQKSVHAMARVGCVAGAMKPDRIAPLARKVADGRRPPP